MIKSIHTDKAPKVVGPYSQATEIGGLVFCSGQIGINPKTGELVSGVEKQTTQVLKNLEAVLEESGANKKSVVKTTIFLADINDYGKVNELYETFFADHKPARSTVAVAHLPKDALIEIEATAVVVEQSQGGCCGNC